MACRSLWTNSRASTIDYNLKISIFRTKLKTAYSTIDMGKSKYNFLSIYYNFPIFWFGEFFFMRRRSVVGNLRHTKWIHHHQQIASTYNSSIATWIWQISCLLCIYASSDVYNGSNPYYLWSQEKCTSLLTLKFSSL